MNAPSADGDRERLGPQPPAIAIRAGLLRHIRHQPGLECVLVGILELPLEVWDDAVEAIAALRQTRR